MTPGIGFRGIVRPNVVGRIDYGYSKEEAPSSPAWISHTDMLCSDDRRGGSTWRALVAGLIGMACLHPSSASAEGFGLFLSGISILSNSWSSTCRVTVAVLEPGALDVRLELAETAAIYSEAPPGATASVKFETLRNGLFLRYGATRKLEIALEVPVLYRYTGFMSGAIEAVERATTGISPARQALSHVSYAYSISRNGQQIVSGTKGAVGLGDSTLQAKYQLLNETSSMPALSLRTAVKLPTGNEREFFGSGSPDFGIGIAAEKRLGGRWILYGNLSTVLPTGRIAGLPLYPTISGMAATEYLWSDNLSLTLQFDYYTTPFRHAVSRCLTRAPQRWWPASTTASPSSGSGKCMPSKTSISLPEEPRTSPWQSSSPTGTEHDGRPSQKGKGPSPTENGLTA